MTTTFTIDAKGKKIGRVASQAAKILMGKATPGYAKNKVAEVKLTIENASKADVTAKKLDTKIYKAYSGYPGGLKEATMKQVVEKKGYGEIFRDAIVGMLPGNKLAPKMMKNLTINE